MQSKPNTVWVLMDRDVPPSEIWTSKDEALQRAAEIGERRAELLWRPGKWPEYVTREMVVGWNAPAVFECPLDEPDGGFALVDAYDDEDAE